jgi:hypothetical protein
MPCLFSRSQHKQVNLHSVIGIVSRLYWKRLEDKGRISVKQSFGDVHS